jgi:predicted HTH domain antitoxin
MTIQINIELPNDVFSALRTNPETFVQEMRLAAAVKWYEVGTLSQSKAAEIAGVSRQQFLEALDRYNVSPFQVTPEELAQELARD